MVSMGQAIKREFSEFRVLLRSIPPLVLVLFVISVFLMNLLANKSISLPFSWLALDCGVIVSWFPFLIMDVVTKHFGHKAANELSVLAILMELLLSLTLLAGSAIPGVWGESFVPGSEDVINGALNRTFGGTWYILAGSALAFLTSSFVNNFLNWGLGRLPWRRPDGFGAFAVRTYVSTAAGQFTDNLVFALVVSHIFFGWTLLQCVGCALTGMLVELLCEALFSAFGYRICLKWKRDKVGEEYLTYKQKGADAV